LFCLDKLVHEPEVLTRYTVPQLVELAGSQRVELLTWIAMRGALPGRVTQIHRNYHVPISNTATGLLVLENSASTEDSAVRAAKALA
jgi:protocatechuate 4,5-dioxygenase, beta chain